MSERHQATQDARPSGPWGGVWNRPGLDLKYRSLVVVSVLAATGHNEALQTLSGIVTQG
jgi:alkylhydroperoxidase/carboxymuconolactone decarboxylase family protein YurZ